MNLSKQLLTRYSLAITMALSLGVTMTASTLVHAELVYEDESSNASTSSDASSVDVNNNSDELNASDDRVVSKSNSESASSQTLAARVEGRKELTKSDLMRRQRLREELKNEDLLTQKLEELRLKDEMKRTEQLTSDVSLSGVQKTEAAATLPVALKEERVGSAANENNVGVQATQASQQNSAMDSSAAMSNVNHSSSSATSVAEIKDTSEEKTEEMRVSITPRGGLSSITNSIYNVESKYAVGLGVSVDVTDHIAFTGGYSFARYGLSAGNAFSYPVGFNMGYLQQVNLNDNVIDLGARAYLLGQKSRVRPFVGAGAAYRTGYVNYDDNTVNYLRRLNSVAAQDVNISGFAGYLETGLEFKITKSISINGTFRYFNIFSSRQSNPLDPNAFLNQNGYNNVYGGSYGTYYGALGSYPGLGYTNDARAQAGDALSKNNFYQLMAGISVSF